LKVDEDAKKALAAGDKDMPVIFEKYIQGEKTEKV